MDYLELVDLMKGVDVGMQSTCVLSTNVLSIALISLSYWYTICICNEMDRIECKMDLRRF